MTAPLPPQIGTSSLSRRVRFGASLGLLRMAGAFTRGASRLADLATGFASRALDPDDRNALTAAIYGSETGAGRTALFAWEEAWLARDLPAQPARVLLGGAGRGCESRWLIERGYSVIAFDPAHEHVALHKVSCPQADAFVVDYDSLARASRARRDGDQETISSDAARILDGAPYDAALLGWGSFTHVLEERSQDELFEALASLVPRGPLLASFLMNRVATAGGRVSQVGAKLGEALGPGTRAYANSSGARNVRCLPHLGFAYSFDRERLEQLAQCAGRRLELHEDSAYPHATFR